jgi:hypothetical protein
VVKKLFILLILIAVTFIFLIVFANKYLIINKPQVAKNILIEGWIPQYTLERELINVNLKNYTNIYITGISGNYDTAYFNNLKKDYEIKCDTVKESTTMVTSGTLYITDKAIEKLKKKNIYNKITVYSHGDSAYYKNAHFFVSIADSVIGNTFSTKNTHAFKVNGVFETEKLKSFNIFYDNDMRFGNFDRNLIIDSIAFNNIVLSNKSEMFYIAENSLPDGIRNYPFHSNAKYIKAYLQVLGFNENFIVVDTLYTIRNKTWGAAKHFSQLYKKEFSNGEALNILSFHYHARRSYLTYKHVLPNANIGIIPLMDIEPEKFNLKIKCESIYTIMDEYTSIIGNIFYN